MRRSRLILACLAALAVGAGAARAADDSIFDFLRQDQLRRQGLSPAQRPARAPAVAPKPAAPISSVPVVRVPQSRSYCVRTCDGYYFSVGFARNQSQVDQQRDMCAASCGDAPMKLYTATLEGQANNGSTGPAIERATDDTGALYTALPTAFAFRNAENPGCFCKTTVNGLPQIPISIDPTLRAGDIVVMPDGLKVFRGTAEAPHKDTDFVSVATSKALPSFIRQQMLSLQDHIAPQ